VVKQVILVRTDLNMRKGKLAAQVAHASMKVFFDRKVSLAVIPGAGDPDPDLLQIPLTPAMTAWVNGTFTKIVLGVESEAELVQAYELAVAQQLPVSIITDIGATEFHGVPTRTAVAIGPAEADLIDRITGPNGVVKTKLL
jgi:PTH2 family peptidyl-tRNA hydrolase